MFKEATVNGATSYQCTNAFIMFKLLYKMYKKKTQLLSVLSEDNPAHKSRTLLEVYLVFEHECPSRFQAGFRRTQ